MGLSQKFHHFLDSVQTVGKLFMVVLSTFESVSPTDICDCYKYCHFMGLVDVYCILLYTRMVLVVRRHLTDLFDYDFNCLGAPKSHFCPKPKKKLFAKSSRLYFSRNATIKVPERVFFPRPRNFYSKTKIHVYFPKCKDTPNYIFPPRPKLVLHKVVFSPDSKTIIIFRPM